jgi:DNA-binding HxlR family transcriptional regulator
MRSYDQYCGLAKALDTIGDRWTLLVVRELLGNGPSRYSDLQHGLPGIATNLLADRLRALEDAGVVTREGPAPPVATPLFALTDWGMQLRPIIMALGAWASPLLGNSRGQTFRSHWLVLPLETHIADRTPSRPPLQVELRTGERPMMLVTTGTGGVRVRAARAGEPSAAVLDGAPELIIAVLAGRMTPSTARARGLRTEGDMKALKRFGARKSSVVDEGKAARSTSI